MLQARRMLETQPSIGTALVHVEGVRDVSNRSHELRFLHVGVLGHVRQRRRLVRTQPTLELIKI